MVFFKNFLFCFVLVFFQTAYAATLKVTSIADSGPGSLRQTISDAVSGDVIYFDAGLSGGTITLTTRIDTEIDNKNLTIDAMSLPNSINITDGRGAECSYGGVGNNCNAIRFSSSGYTLKIRGITFVDAQDVPIANDPGTTLIVDYCTFKDNNNDLNGDWGGGIQSWGDLHVTNSTFNNNGSSKK